MRANQMLPLARLHQDVHVLIGALHPENFVAILKIFLVDLIAEKLIIGTTSSMPRKYFLDNRQRVSRAMQSRDVLIAPDVLVCAPRRKTARASGLWLPWRCGSSLRTLILSLAWMKFRSARITCLLSVLIITLFENLKRRIPSAAYFFWGSNNLPSLHGHCYLRNRSACGPGFLGGQQRIRRSNSCRQMCKLCKKSFIHFLLFICIGRIDLSCSVSRRGGYKKKIRGFTVFSGPRNGGSSRTSNKGFIALARQNPVHGLSGPACATRRWFSACG